MTSGYLSYKDLATLLKYKTHTNTHCAYNFINLSTESLQCKNMPCKSNTQVRNKYKQGIHKQAFLFLYFIAPWCFYYCNRITVKNLKIFLENVHGTDLKSLLCELSWKVDV